MMYLHQYFYCYNAFAISVSLEVAFLFLLVATLMTPSMNVATILGLAGEQCYY